MFGALAFAIACSVETESSDYGESTQELCTGAGLTANDADYTAAPGQTVTWTATANCQFANPEYRFWRQAPGGSYVLVQDWSTSNTFVWNTTGATQGTYNWQVWVREAGSTAAYETYRARSFLITSVTSCTSVSATAAPAGAGVGTPVTVTATGNCGGQPAEYAFYRQNPGGSYTLVQPYSASNTFNWSTAGATAGTYRFQVWVRAQGSPKSYDAYTSLAYTLSSSTACTAASVSFTPPSPATQGDIVTIQGGSASCSNPTYKFWLYNGSTWSVLQDWSATSSYSWDTAGVTPGTYTVQVWVRRADSTSTYETYVGRTYTVTTGTSGTLATSIGGGTNFTCQLLGSGQVGCWGYNSEGQLGNGTNTSSLVPVAVSGLTNGLRLSTGYTHACAVISGGAVRCWGDNLHGQLGNGSTSDSNVPVSVSGITGAIGVSSGASHTCALLSNGSVRCWGYNSQGQLGVTASGDRTTPVTVSGLTGVTQLAAGYYHTCALLSGGTVRCWGDGSLSQLGNGGTSDSATPVTVTGLSGVTAISAGSAHTCALLSGGTVQCWGQNQYGVLGNGSTDPSPSPVTVTGLTGASSIAVGPYHACAATTGGSAYCWGLNTYGELGNATEVNSSVPVQVSGLTSAATVGVGHHHSCATLSTGGAVCWGYNTLGALGNNSTTSSNVPVAVTAFP